jgi:hypothetical protein
MVHLMSATILTLQEEKNSIHDNKAGGHRPATSTDERSGCFHLFWSSLGDYLRHKFKDALVQAGGAPADFQALATKTAVFVLNTVSCLPA